MCRKLLLLAVVFGVIIASSSAASAAIITNVVRSAGVTDNRTPIGPYDGEIDPLPTQAGGLMDGNIVFSDRDYLWSLTPTALIGAEYVRTFSSDRTTATVTYAVTFSQPATVLLSVDDRFSPQQTTVNGIVSRFASAGTFTDTGLNVYIHENSTTDRPMSVFSAVLPAGTYTFGGQGNANNFYTIIALPPPGKARNPWPGDGSMVDADAVILTWEPGESAALHDVYCSTSFDDVDTATTSSGDVYKGRQTELVYPPGPFDTMAVNRGDTYYWRIDEVSGVNVCRGDIWSFEVLSNLNWGPSPAHQATFVPVTTDLSWSKGNWAKVGHIIYLSTDFATVNNKVPGTTSGAGYLGAASPGTVTTIAIPGDLLYNTTYYWRADAVEKVPPAMPGNTHKGGVWSFTTAPENGVGTILLIAPNGAEVLISGGVYTVTWSSTGPISNILIEYSIDDGQSWSRINAVPNSGSCDWLVPAVNSNQCLVRISDANDPSINDVSDGVFTIFRGLTTIYVDDDATGANDGSSWANAYRYLQDALADANTAPKPAEIHVARGTYRPDEDTLHPSGTGERTAAFRLINGVSLKGGYAGAGSPDPDARNIALHETVLTGDLSSNDIADLDPSELLNHPSRSENSYHIFYHPKVLNLDDTAILAGFTITGGNAESMNGPRNCGGGMANHSGSSPTVKDCTFTVNSAFAVGGGMDNDNSSPTLRNCTFSGNSAQLGGGMYNRSYSSPSVNNCIFIGNLAHNGGGMENLRYSSPIVKNCTFSTNSASEGGGMFNYEYSSPTIEKCSFTKNLATESAGGMENLDNSSPTVINCTFSENSAGYRGGGMYNWHFSYPTLTDCTFSGNSADNDGGGMCNQDSSPTLRSCTFGENSAQYGGGISNYCYYVSRPTVINCTIAYNNASNGPAMACDSYEHNYPSSVRMVNSIVWNGPNWVWNNDSSTIDVNYSDVEGDWPGVGNINTDPCFVQPEGWIPIQGLISYWKFDEGSGTTALDSVGNNNGTIYGAEWMAGQVGGALNFDGDNDYVSILANPALNNLNAVTLEAWVYPRKDSHWHILDKGDGDKRLYAEGTSLSMDGRVRYSGNHAYVRSISNTVILNTWQHVVLTWSRLDNTSRLYRNGVEVSYSIKTMGSGSVLDDTSHPWTIGARGALGEVTFFDGLIDEAALYARVLSAQEIQQHYQKGLLGQGYLDAATPDYHLLPSSPCINAGDPNYVPEPNETDMDGEARVMWETVDMGADEFNPIRFVDPNRTRKSRTEFLYDCNVSFTNLWPFAIKNVQLEMLSAPDNMDINEPNVSFGDIECTPRESITSIDTCTFKVDRSQAIEPAQIIWRVNCTRADTGVPIELTIGGVGSAGLESMGGEQGDFEGLVGLADNWLWVGAPGGIDEDTVPDGTVNLADFAEFAENWKR